MTEELQNTLYHEIASCGTPLERITLLAEIRELLFSLSPTKMHPVDLIRWVPIEKVHANSYNPNSVATVEMRLLHTSIKHDGYTQPCVTVYDQETDRYVLVDGFHRYLTMRNNTEIAATTGGLLPVVVIDKPLAERMASTVRHNRARGTHSVTGMSTMVFALLEQGMDDAGICNELGMEPEELNRLKHITGFAVLFKDATYSPAWAHRNQLELAEKLP